MIASRLDQARRLQNYGYLLSWAEIALDFSYLVGLIFWGAALLWRVLPQPVGFVALVFAGWLLVPLPIRYARFVAERSAGLSLLGAGQWWAGQVKRFLLNLSVLTLAGALVGRLWQWAPATWHLWAAGLVALLLWLFAYAGPVLIAPLFGRYTPMEDGPLKSRLEELAVRAGVPVRGIYVERVSGRETVVKAEVSGVGATRRIIFSDTMLSAYTPAEVAAVMGHELGHQRYWHIPQLIGLHTVKYAAPVLAAGYWLPPASGASGFEAMQGLPVLVLLFMVADLAFRPIRMMISRRWERLCDQFAVKLTGDREAMVSALAKRAEQNQSGGPPPAWAYWFFVTHPTEAERIAMVKRTPLQEASPS